MTYIALFTAQLDVPVRGGTKIANTPIWMDNTWVKTKQIGKVSDGFTSERIFHLNSLRWK